MAVRVARWACLGLLLATPSAAARPATEIQQPNRSALVFLGKGGGYELALLMPNPRVAILYAAQLGDPDSGLNVSQSSYAVRVPAGKLEHGVVRAHFPSMGDVRLRFHPNGKRRVHRRRSHCRGRSAVTEAGTFRGTVSLEGEGGYFQRRLRSAKGSLERSFRLRCRKGYAGETGVGLPLWRYVAPGFGFFYSTGSGTIALLYALYDDGHRYIGIRAAHSEGAPAGAEVQIGALESRRKMAIGRSAYLDGDIAGTLTTSLPGEHPATATLAPPAPFHGEAHYLENSANSHSWTGDLTVSFPGLELPLTGGEFKTSLCVVSPLKVPNGCDFIKPKPLRSERANVPRWSR